MNEKKIEKLWKEILKEIDEDINRAGIKEIFLHRIQKQVFFYSY